MKRLTTDTPNGNFETMLNFVHGKDGWAHIYDEDGKEVNLITWALNHCHDRGCDDFQCETLEEYDEALSRCMEDYMDCPIAMAYCFASQAVHLRDQLKMYEDAMSLERARELAQAEKDGRLVVLPPCKAGDRIFRIVNMESHSAYKNFVTFEEVLPFGVPIKSIFGGAIIIPIECFGKTVFLTREEAEAALKKKEEADNEFD